MNMGPAEPARDSERAGEDQARTRQHGPAEPARDPERAGEDQARTRRPPAQGGHRPRDRPDHLRPHVRRRRAAGPGFGRPSARLRDGPSSPDACAGAAERGGLRHVRVGARQRQSRAAAWSRPTPSRASASSTRTTNEPITEPVQTFGKLTAQKTDDLSSTSEPVKRIRDSRVATGDLVAHDRPHQRRALEARRWRGGRRAWQHRAGPKLCEGAGGSRRARARGPQPRSGASRRGRHLEAAQRRPRSTASSAATPASSPRAQSLGIDAARLRSMIEDLAYVQAKASGGPGDRLSSQDVERAARMIGDGLGDPVAMRAVLEDLKSRQLSQQERFENTYRQLYGDKLKDVPMWQRPGARPRTAAAAPAGAQPAPSPHRSGANPASGSGSTPRRGRSNERHRGRGPRRQHRRVPGEHAARDVMANAMRQRFGGSAPAPQEGAIPPRPTAQSFQPPRRPSRSSPSGHPQPQARGAGHRPWRLGRPPARSPTWRTCSRTPALVGADAASSALGRPSISFRFPSATESLRASAGELASRLGYEAVTPETMKEKMAVNALDFATQNVILGPLLGRLAAARAPAMNAPNAVPRFGDTLLKPYMDAPVKARLGTRRRRRRWLWRGAHRHAGVPSERGPLRGRRNGRGCGRLSGAAFRRRRRRDDLLGRLQDAVLLMGKFGMFSPDPNIPINRPPVKASRPRPPTAPPLTCRRRRTRCPAASIPRALRPPPRRSGATRRVRRRGPARSDHRPDLRERGFEGA